MRLLVGIILGAALTVLVTYVIDHRPDADIAQRMVNWNVVEQNWEGLTARARAEWNRLAG